MRKRVKGEIERGKRKETEKKDLRERLIFVCKWDQLIYDKVY